MTASASVISSKKKLNDVCELIVDCEHKTAPTQETGYPSIRTPNIGKGRLILDHVKRVSEETYKIWTKRAVPREGDLILAREAPVGNVAIIPSNLKVCLGQRTVLIRTDRTKIDNYYLLYLLLGREVQGIFHSFAAGCTVPHLNMGDIRRLELPQLPPRSIQRKISAVLTTYDELIENNLRRIKILEEMAQTIYREWFVNFRFPGHEKVRLVDSTFGKIPEGWEVKKVGDLLAKVKRKGKIKKQDYEEQGPVPVVDQGRDFIGGYTSNLEARHDDPLPIIVFGDHTRILKYIDFPFACGADGTQLLSSNTDRLPPPLFFYMLETIDLSDHAYARHFKFLKEQEVVVPQLEVAQYFSIIVDPMRDEIRCLQSKNDILHRTHHLLLPKLISGELDVSDLDIEIGEEAA